MRRIGLCAALAFELLLGACCNAENKEAAGGAPGAAGRHGMRLEQDVGGTKIGLELTSLDDAGGTFAQRLRDATTVNVDAPGLKPLAKDALGGAAELGKATGGPEGLVVAASEADATFSVDGWAAEKLGGAAAQGWHRGAKRAAAGAHSLRVEKPGFFPVETQVIVRPGTWEVIAVRLGKVVMKAGGPK